MKLITDAPYRGTAKKKVRKNYLYLGLNSTIRQFLYMLYHEQHIKVINKFI